MVINSYSPQLPTLNSDIIRPQKSPDSSPESTVLQSRHVAPIPDVRVVQQAGESSQSNGAQDPKFSAKQNEVDGGHGNPGQAKVANSELLSRDEQREVESLAQRDREVRAHEQAHLSAAGSRATSGASFSYTEGPNGKRYATGGEVGVDTSPVRGDPEATLRVAELLQRAALAPAEPSTQDRQVAAAASAMGQMARAELSQQRADEASHDSTEGAVVGQEERKSATIEGDGPGATSGEAAATKQGEVVAAPVVDTRGAQTQLRQQLLDNVFSAVERGLEGDLRGANIDNFHATTGEIAASRIATQSAVEPAGQLRAAVTETEHARVEVGLQQRDDERAPTTVERAQASVLVDESSLPSTDEPQDKAAIDLDKRDEQVKSRHQQLEGAFSDVAQGLGGEPRGTNLDYFL